LGAARRLALCTLLALSAEPAMANRARLLATDSDAAEARIEVALAARSELLVSSFIVGDDPLSLTSLALLRDAARRGVHVELLVDAQWNRIPRAVLAHLLAEGIEIREFHWFRFDRLGWIFRRMHDKLVVADGETVIAGGRNVESPYFGFGRQLHRRNYIDMDLEVDGEVATAARDYFGTVWRSRHVRPVPERANAEELAVAAAELDRRMSWLDGKVEEESREVLRPMRALQEVGPVTLLHDPIGDWSRSGGVGRELGDLLAQARDSVHIESPYLIPSRALRKSLLAAVARGVRVRILTNSLATTDNLFAQAGYVGRRKELVVAGIELWEYSGPECLHAKAAVLDGETAIVGSYNLDPRSERLNRELALVVRDRGLAGRLDATFDEHLRNAWRIDARGWPEGADKPFPGVSRGKVFRLRLLRLLTPFIEGQL
jgi:cardiolipin synthase C